MEKNELKKKMETKMKILMISLWNWHVVSISVWRPTDNKKLNVGGSGKGRSSKNEVVKMK